MGTTKRMLCLPSFRKGLHAFQTELSGLRIPLSFLGGGVCGFRGRADALVHMYNLKDRGVEYA